MAMPSSSFWKTFSLLHPRPGDVVRLRNQCGSVASFHVSTRFFVSAHRREKFVAMYCATAPASVKRAA